MLVGSEANGFNGKPHGPLALMHQLELEIEEKSMTQLCQQVLSICERKRQMHYLCYGIDEICLLTPQHCITYTRGDTEN